MVIATFSYAKIVQDQIIRKCVSDAQHFLNFCWTSFALSLPFLSHEIIHLSSSQDVFFVVCWVFFKKKELNIIHNSTGFHNNQMGFFVSNLACHF